MLVIYFRLDVLVIISIIVIIIKLRLIGPCWKKNIHHPHFSFRRASTYKGEDGDAAVTVSDNVKMQL